MLSFRFEQCLGPFTMLLGEGSSQTGPFIHLCNKVFLQSVISEIHKLWGSFFFSKCSKVHLHFKNTEKNVRKCFCFIDNSIWIGYVELSMLRREYLSSAANDLTNGAEILDITNRDFFQLIFLLTDEEIW